jgi:hypothetical protein
MSSLNITYCDPDESISLTSDSTGQYLVLAGDYGCFTYVSVDFGASWTEWDSRACLWSIDSDSTGQYLVGASSAGLYTSSTYGYKWEIVSVAVLDNVASNSDGSVWLASFVMMMKYMPILTRVTSGLTR